MSNNQITIHAKKINIQQVDTINLDTLTETANTKTPVENEDGQCRTANLDETDSADIQTRDLKDVTGFSPRFMTFNEKQIVFSKNRWTEVIQGVIKFCSITREQFIDKIPVIQKGNLPQYDVSAVYGKVNGYYVVPERNGWVYIPEFDISIRIKTGNKMFETVKTLVKGTVYEGKTCLFLNNDHQKNRYRIMSI